MMGRDSNEDRDAYGLWPWIAGVALGGTLIWIMFQFAQSIS